MKKVSPGQPLEIPASAYNAFVDAARQNAERTHDHLRQTPAFTTGSDWVYIRNESGTPRDRHDVLTILGPLVDPAQNLSEFRGRVALRGGLPQNVTRMTGFAVMLEPVPVNGIGRACVSGVCITRVVMRSENDRFAGTRWSSSWLVSGVAGCELLWVTPPDQRPDFWAWAVVKLGFTPTPRGDIRPVYVKVVQGSGPNFTYDIYDYSANTQEPVVTGLPYLGRWTAGSVGLWGPAPSMSLGIAFYDPIPPSPTNRYTLLWCQEKLTVAQINVPGASSGASLMVQ